jgi:hypothetical protein
VTLTVEFGADPVIHGISRSEQSACNSSEADRQRTGAQSGQNGEKKAARLPCPAHLSQGTLDSNQSKRG